MLKSNPRTVRIFSDLYQSEGKIAKTLIRGKKANLNISVAAIEVPKERVKLRAKRYHNSALKIVKPKTF